MFRAVFPVAALAAVIAARPLAGQDTAAVKVEVAIARDVADRMPVDTASAFPADVGRLACWTRVTGAAGTTIQHVWIRGTDEYPVSLQVGGSPWRVWSTKQIPAEWAGDWRVEVRDGAGHVLATAQFKVGS
jgi:hypothetical protein